MANIKDMIDDFIIMAMKCLNYQWIYDRLNNKEYHDRGTMRKKIRKSLGYNG